MWFQNAWQTVRGNRRRKRAASARFARPKLEELQPRIVPATNEWIGPAYGLWSVPSNWSLGHTPQASEMLITGSTPSTDDLKSVSVITWTNQSSTITINPGNSVAGQQYIYDSGGLSMMPGSTISSDNYIYEYGNITAMAGPMGPNPLATITISSPNVIFETGTTVTATGGNATTPGLLINGGVEQYGALNVGLPTGATATVEVTGSKYVINLSGSATINFGSTLSYTGTPPLQDQGTIVMKGATLDSSLIYLDNLIDSQGVGDTIVGTVDVHGGTLAVDSTYHTLTITGDLDMPNGTLSLILNGGGGNSAVDVGGSITLGNGTSQPTLTVKGLIPVGRTPDTWTLMTAGSITGDFGTLNLPPLPPPPPPLAWSTLNTGTTYSIFTYVPQ